MLKIVSHALLEILSLPPCEVHEQRERGLAPYRVHLPTVDSGVEDFESRLHSKK